MTTPTERRQHVLSLLEQRSIGEVAAILGLSRQRVHQIVGTGALEPLTERRRRHAEALWPEIVERWLAERDDAAVAAALGIPPVIVGLAVGKHLPDADVLVVSPRRRRARYRDADIAEALRLVVATRAESDGVLAASPLSFVEYERLAPQLTLSDGRPLPSAQTITVRFRRWRDALVATGLPVHASSQHRATFDADAARRAIADAWRQLGTPPTARAYEDWCRRNRRGPSLGTVQRHFAAWNEALAAAWDLVHGDAVRAALAAARERRAS